MSVAQSIPSARLRVQRSLPFDGSPPPVSRPRPSLKGPSPRRRLVLAELPAPGPTAAAQAITRIALPARLAPVMQVIGTAFVFAVCLLAVAYL